ncbi:MAG: InlB B-repeat-containing protein [Treponema sp.]|nr:InlB B-repeat-containing protein [Treponema sp.]
MKTKSNKVRIYIFGFSLLLLTFSLFFACESPTGSSAKTYTVEYDANGGEGQMEKSVFKVGVLYELPANEFTCGGHSFSGWALASDGSVVYPEEAEVIDLAESKGTITLYAVWLADMDIIWPADLAAVVGWHLSDILLTGRGSAAVPGEFTWTNPDDPVGSEGVQTHNMTFTPEDTVNYSIQTRDVLVTVVSEDSYFVAWPVGITAVYGQRLSEVYLFNMGYSTVAGTFSWTTPTSLVGGVGMHTHNMTFTPEDRAKYEIMTGNVNVIVNRATPSVTVWPAADTITYGQQLSDSALSGGTSGVPGTFAWTDGTIVPTVTNSGYEVTFTPNDAVNYNAVTNTVAVMVNGRDLSNATVTVSGTFTYTGSAHTPTPTVTDGGLIATSDYTVSYSNNTNAGTATVTITAAAEGNYTGTQSACFTIDKAMLTISITNPNRSTFTPLPGETSAIVAIGGFVGSENPYATISDTDLPAGFTLSGTRITYDGTSAFPNPDITIGFTITTTDTNYEGGTTIVPIFVYDGLEYYTGTAGTFDRRIPVNQANINTFNTYARNTNGITRHYKQVEDITLNLPSPGGSNWTAIGFFIPLSNYAFFTGSYDGQGFTITNLTINRTTDYQGMFGVISGNGTTTGIVKNLGLINCSITSTQIAGNCIGSLVGRNNGGMVQNCYSTGNISGWYCIGGVVGGNEGILQNCYSTGSVSGIDHVGGVAGVNFIGGILQNCYSTSIVIGNYNINGNKYVGGVVGSNGRLMQNCYSTGSVIGIEYVGGIMGANNASSGIRPGTTLNCAAFNPIVVASDNTNIIGRIAGENNGVSLSHMYARNPMTVKHSWNGTTGTDKNPLDKGLDEIDGADITEAQWNAASWWTSAANWNTTDGSVWDTDIWDITDGRLPRLLNMPGGLEAQNPVIQ